MINAFTQQQVFADNSINVICNSFCNHIAEINGPKFDVNFAITKQLAKKLPNDFSGNISLVEFLVNDLKLYQDILKITKKFKTQKSVEKYNEFIFYKFEKFNIIIIYNSSVDIESNALDWFNLKYI